MSRTASRSCATHMNYMDRDSVRNLAWFRTGNSILDRCCHFLFCPLRTLLKNSSRNMLWDVRMIAHAAHDSYYRRVKPIVSVGQCFWVEIFYSYFQWMNSWCIIVQRFEKCVLQRKITLIIRYKSRFQKVKLLVCASLVLLLLEILKPSKALLLWK